jgi:hypothetical protein
MRVDLSAIDRRLGRAEEHLDSLKAQEAEWGDRQREFITLKLDTDPHSRRRRMSRPAWFLGDGPEQLSYAATSLPGA